MAVRDEILNDELQISRVQQWPHCKAVENRHISYTGESTRWSISYGEGCGNIWPKHIGVYPAIPLLEIY